jgi:hypothetical protein
MNSRTGHTLGSTKSLYVSPTRVFTTHAPPQPVTSGSSSAFFLLPHCVLRLGVPAACTLYTRKSHTMRKKKRCHTPQNHPLSPIHRYASLHLPQYSPSLFQLFTCFTPLSPHHPAALGRKSMHPTHCGRELHERTRDVRLGLLCLSMSLPPACIHHTCHPLSPSLSAPPLSFTPTYATSYAQGRKRIHLVQ